MARHPVKPGVHRLVFLALIASWMVAVLLPVGPRLTGDPASGLALAVESPCDEQGGSGLYRNWGEVADDAASDPCSGAARNTTTANWGSVPAKDVVVRVPIGGKTIVVLPETVGQAAGEVGAKPGDQPADPAKPCQASEGSLPGEWDPIQRWDGDIQTMGQQVFQETGVLVPTNVVKAIMRIESGGNPLEGPAYGLLQVTAGAMGSYDLDRTRSDPTYGIYAGIKDLALRYLDSGKLPWENVIVGYFSGHYYPTGSRDQFSSDYEYQDRFKQFFAELEAALPTDRECGPGTSVVGVASLWGNLLFGGAPPILSQDFGPTDFSRYVHPEWYSYALDYGFQEPGHTGLDVAIPAGTPLYTPMDASVICAGTNNGTGEDSCSAFLSVYGGPTSGRLQVKMPNGDMLILGHVNESLVKPGDQVKAGQQIGISGGFNGDHVHVEYRVRNQATRSGWEIIDPRIPLDGVKVNVRPGSGGQSGGPSSGPGDRDNDGLTDDLEAQRGSSPDDPDSDDDRLIDGAEVISYGTDPVNADSDGDGLADGDEIETHRSDPLATDGDNDGLPDFDEVMTYTTNPSAADSDGDGASDADEVNGGSNPLDAGSVPTTTDGDADGVADGRETVLQTDPVNPDSDGDGLSDGDEVNTYGSSPLNGDSDADGLPDYNEVLQWGTSPTKSDTDEDGFSDHDEVSVGSNPLDAASTPDTILTDADGDGLNEATEASYGTDPFNPDSDGDGAGDGFEVQSGTNPLDPTSVPVATGLEGAIG